MSFYPEPEYHLFLIRSILWRGNEIETSTFIKALFNIEIILYLAKLFHFFTHLLAVFSKLLTAIFRLFYSLELQFCNYLSDFTWALDTRSCTK